MTRRRRLAGLTLAEVLVAISIGVLLTLSVATLHARILRLAADTTRVADAQDTLRIALALLEYELAHAGYWGLVAEAAQLEGHTGSAAPLAVGVAGDCGSGWTLDLEQPLEAWSSGWPLACAPFGGVAPASGVLVLRRAETRTSVPEARRLQVQADPWSGRVIAGGEAADPGAETRNLVARAYYISPRSTGDAARPSLRRKTLQRGPRLIDEEVLPGIAAMEILLGIDDDPTGTPGHGLPDRFLAPESAIAPVVAVRLSLRSDGPHALSMTRTVALRNGPAP